MSNIKAYPPIIEVPIFNIENYIYYNQTATIADLMKYLPLTGGSITGNLFVNGLLSVNSNSLLIGSTIMTSTATELNYLSGVTLGTVTASKALTANSGGTITFLNTNDSILINNTSSNGRSNIKFQNDISTSWEIGLRGSTTGSYPNSLYFYSGGYRLILNNSGDMQVLSTTASSSTTTGALTISGGVGIGGNLNIGGSSFFQGLTANSTSTFNGTTTFNNNVYTNNNITFNNYTNGILNVNYVNLAYSYSINGIIACNSNYNIYLQSPSFSGVYGYMSLNNNGVFINRSNYNPTGTCNSGCLLDFGSQASDMTINFFGGTYGIGANNNQLQFMSGGSAGFAWYTGSSYAPSTYLADMTNVGSFTVNNKLRAKGSSSANFSGSGLELGYNGTYGEIYAYNRSSLLFKGIYIGNEMYLDGSGHVSVGIGAVASSWKLEVGTNIQNVSSYGYLNSGGSVGFSGGSGSVSFSAYFQGRIAVQGEVDVLSDVRVKSNIRNITDEEAEKFIHNCIPKHYIFKPESNNEKQYGYIAQDIAKVGLDTLIVCRHQEGLDELIDEDGFVSPKDTEFTVSYMKIPALLHKYILMLESQTLQRFKNIEKKLEDITNQLSNMSIVDVKVNNDLSGLHDLLKDLKLKN